jgi:hypothetical protein
MKFLSIFIIIAFGFGSFNAINGDFKALDIDVNYAIENINRHITTLESFHINNTKLKPIFRIEADGNVIITDSIVVFGHDLICICVKKILHEQSLDPLFAVWRLFVGEYKDIETEMFVLEMSILLFSIYRNILFSFNEANNAGEPILDPATLQEINKLYAQVATLPIKQVLMALDKCYGQFMLIMRDYEINSQMGWIEWIQNYWWVPPVVVTSAIITAVNVFFVDSNKPSKSMISVHLQGN